MQLLVAGRMGAEGKQEMFRASLPRPLLRSARASRGVEPGPASRVFPPNNLSVSVQGKAVAISQSLRARTATHFHAPLVVGQLNQFYTTLCTTSMMLVCGVINGFVFLARPFLAAIFHLPFWCTAATRRAQTDPNSASQSAQLPAVKPFIAQRRF